MNITQIGLLTRFANSVPMQTTAMGVLARITVAAEGDPTVLTATQAGVLARINLGAGWTPSPKMHKPIHGANAFNLQVE